MSDLLRVVERSQDHEMDIEDYLAREQLGEEGDGPDRAASRRLRRVSFSAELRAGAADGLGGAGRASLRARDRRRHAARGPLPLLRPPGLRLPDRLRAAARPGRRARAAAGRHAPLRRARAGRARDRDGAARRLRGALGHRRATSSRPSPRRRPPRRTATSSCAPRRSATSAELAAALLPCMWGYAEIGARLAAAGPPDHPGYAAWIATYADPSSRPSRPGAASWPTRRAPVPARRDERACRPRSRRRASTSSRSGTAPGATRAERRRRGAHRCHAARGSDGKLRP